MELKKQPPPAPNQGARDCDVDAHDLLPCRLSMVQMRAGVDVMGFAMRGSSGACKQGQKLPTIGPRSPAEGTDDGTKEAAGADGATW